MNTPLTLHELAFCMPYVKRIYEIHVCTQKPDAEKELLITLQKLDVQKRMLLCKLANYLNVPTCITQELNFFKYGLMRPDMLAQFLQGNVQAILKDTDFVTLYTQADKQEIAVHKTIIESSRTLRDLVADFSGHGNEISETIPLGFGITQEDIDMALPYIVAAHEITKSCGKNTVEEENARACLLAQLHELDYKKLVRLMIIAEYLGIAHIGEAALDRYIDQLIADYNNNTLSIDKEQQILDNFTMLPYNLQRLCIQNIVDKSGIYQVLQYKRKDAFSCLYTIHKEYSVTSVCYSPDTVAIAIGGCKNQIELIDSKTKIPIRWFFSKPSKSDYTQYNNITFSPQGTYLAATSYFLERQVMLWNLKTGHLSFILSHPNSISSLAFSDDESVLITGCYDTHIRWWSISSGECLKVLEAHEGGIDSFSMSSLTQEILFIPAYTNEIYAYNSTTHTITKKCEFDLTHLGNLCINPMGNIVAVSNRDHRIVLFTVSTDPATELKLCNKLERVHKKEITALTFNPDGNILASASEDGTIALWDVVTGALLKLLTGHNQKVTSISFSPNGLYLVSGSTDKTMRIWSICDATIQAYIANTISLPQVLLLLQIVLKKNVLKTLMYTQLKNTYDTLIPEIKMIIDKLT